MPRLVTVGLPVVAIGLLLLGIFSGLGARAGEAAVSPTFLDWGRDSRATLAWPEPNYHSNSVAVTRVTWRRNTNTARTFEYMTGGQAWVSDADALATARRNRPPDHLLAKHQEGKVLVRMWGDSQSAGIADEFVVRTARTVHLATTQVWPREPIPVEADVYVMPEGAAFSLARKVKWKSGRPLELAIFNPDGMDLDELQITVAHELHHLLAAFLRNGRWATDGKHNASSIAFGEVAASSFASCGALLADGHLSRPRKDNTLFLNGVEMKSPLSANDVQRILRALRHADTHSRVDLGTLLGGFLDRAPVFQVLGSARERIELRSPQGEQLLEMCREFLFDPSKIEPWIESLGEEQTVPSG